MAPTPKQQAAMALYADLMEEAKIRFAAIDYMLNGGVKLPSPIISECCLLQIRLLCEIVALGCLAAQGDIVQRSLTKDAWTPKEIFRALNKLHPDFYPHPTKFERVDNPSPDIVLGLSVIRKPEDGSFLTKAELLTLYGRCNDRLHRGPLDDLLKSSSPIQTRFADIAGWTNKIVALLDGHHIALLDNKRHFLCALRDSSANDRVQLIYAESPLPP
jgi:hypothetical protein